MEEKSNIYLDLYDLTTNKSFRKYFKCENDRIKFVKKLKYSKKLIIIGVVPLTWYE